MSADEEDVAVRPEVYRALQCINLDLLDTIPSWDLRPVLPALVRMTVMDGSPDLGSRKRLFRCLSGVEDANIITGLLTADFAGLQEDLAAEFRLCEKIGASAAEKSREESILLRDVPQLNDLSVNFERGDASQKFRLILREVVLAIFEMKEAHQFIPPSRFCDLFEHEVYADEVGDVLCIAMAELPEFLSPAAVAQALFRRMPNPSHFICRLVANAPHTFISVCTALITMNEKHEDEMAIGRARCNVLLQLCKMNPWEALTVRSICVDCCRLPGASILITINTVELESPRQRKRRLDGVQLRKPLPRPDVVTFLSGVLLGEKPAVRFLFGQWIKAGQRTMRRDYEANSVGGKPSIASLSAYNQFKLWLVNRVEELVNFNPDNVLSPEHLIDATNILRFYCILKGQAAYNFSNACKLTENETGFLLRLVTMQPPPCPKGGRFISLGLCVLLTCPSLIMAHDKEKVVVRWIRWLVKDFHSEKSSFAELLLLMAILFHGNHLSAIADLVSSTLGIKVVAKPASVQRLKSIFTQEIFTEQVVAAHAVKVPVTRNLSADLPGFLPVHCIFHLVKSRVFTKHKVPIKEWVYRQVLSSKAPLHPILPPLLDVYVTSILIPQKTRAGADDEINDPFSEEQVLAVFRDNSEASTATQLLMLYYLMLYEDLRLNNMKPILASKRVVLKYSHDVLGQIPIKYLLLKAQNEQNNYGVLFPLLLRLLATHYPHLCPVEDWLHRMDSWVSSKYKRFSSGQLKDPNRVGALVADAFANLPRCPAKAVFLLKRLRQLSPAQLRPLGEAILMNAVSLLDSEGNRVPRLAQDLFRELWRKMSIVYPRASWVIAANSLINDGTANGQLALPIRAFYSQDDYTLDPLMVLRCDPRVFQCPPLLEITLRTLRGYLAASRTMLHEHILDQPWLGQQLNQSQQKALGSMSLSLDAERDELKNALITAQESAAVQILLEIAARNDSLGIGELRTSTEVRSLICSHLHQIFIAEPHLVKLVHFQSYPKELLPVTVRGIPSMHICLDFLPELVTTPDVDRLVFATCLLSQLAGQYALPKALSVARLTLSVISTILSALPPTCVRKEFAPIFPALIRLGITFPPLLSDIVSFFVQFGQIAIAAPGVHPCDRSCRRRGVRDGCVGADVFTPEGVVLAFEHFMKQCVLSLNLT